jgi:hypothetical protein
MPQPVLQKGGPAPSESRVPAAQAEITYRVNFVDGSELEITLDETSSVQDAVVAIAHQKGSSPQRHGTV